MKAHIETAQVLEGFVSLLGTETLASLVQKMVLIQF